MESCSVNRYQFEILTKQHKQQAIDILSLAFSYLGQSDYGMIFNTSFNDGIAYYEMVIDHLLKTGLSLVALDKNNNIAMLTLFYDICDEPKINQALVSKSKARINELCDKLEEEILNKYKSECNNLFRKYIVAGWVCIRPDLRARNSHLFAMSNSIPLSIFNYLGYNSCFFNVNSRTFKTFKNHVDNKNIVLLNKLNYSTYTFKDGVTMNDYYKLSNNKNIEKFKQRLTIYFIQKKFHLWKVKQLNIVDAVIYDVCTDFPDHVQSPQKLLDLIPSKL